MNYEQLANELKSRNVIFEQQSGFHGMVPGIESDIRIVCAEKEEERGFSGISFWIYGDRSEWYIGLWSGICFRISFPESIAEIASELLTGHVIPKGKAPGNLPEDFIVNNKLVLYEN